MSPHRITGGMARWLDRVTEPSRVRDATCVFLTGRPPRCDRLISATYFLLTARVWGGYADSEEHLAAFSAGLKRCQAPSSALDLGTGAGATAGLLARNFPTAKVVGLDASMTMLRTARQRHTAPNLNFRRGSTLRLPFESESFDLVTLLNAVPELTELGRVCKRNAQVLVASTSFPLRAECSAWVGRWRDGGFARVAGDSVGRGSWEVFEPVS